MAKPRKPRRKPDEFPPQPRGEPLLTPEQIRARYLDFIRMLARETARRDHEAARDRSDTHRPSK